MAKQNRIIATYRIGPHEVIQAQVDASSSYPDALNQAEVTARRLVRDMYADAMSAPRVQIEDGDS